jgi:hypothetical protein
VKTTHKESKLGRTMLGWACKCHVLLKAISQNGKCRSRETETTGIAV